jgi:hypothetical protein
MKQKHSIFERENGGGHLKFRKLVSCLKAHSADNALTLIRIVEGIYDSRNFEQHLM